MSSLALPNCHCEHRLPIGCGQFVERCQCFCQVGWLSLVLTMCKYTNTIMTLQVEIANIHSYMRARCLSSQDMKHLSRAEVWHPSSLVAQLQAWFQLCSCAFHWFDWVSCCPSFQKGRIHILTVFANIGKCPETSGAWSFRGQIRLLRTM